jgi:hypothetical protein
MQKEALLDFILIILKNGSILLYNKKCKRENTKGELLL